MQFPDLSALPPWAQVIVYATFGVSLAFIIAVARFGVQLGKKAPGSSGGMLGGPTSAATVAAVIVDPTELAKLSAAAGGLEVTLLMLNKTGAAMARAQQAGNRQTEDLTECIRTLVNATDRLRDEVIRRHGRPD